MSTRTTLLLGVALGAGCLLPGVARAQERTVQPPGPALPSVPSPAVAPDPTPGTDEPWRAPATFGEWSSSIKLGLQVNAGVAGSIEGQERDTNFGQLFTDKLNKPILNQVLLSAQRDVDPKATGYDFGFKLALLYGSDARITHTLGVFDRLIHDRLQLDLLEANATARLPWLFQGGIDAKAGIYPTPLGFETIDPKGNPFYSKSYIFNYGLPFKHLGLLTNSHVSPMLDVYLGIDTGTNTSIGSGAGDNNNRPGGIAGIGLNLLGGQLTVLALTHIGPENAKRNTPFGNSALRYFNDVLVTYKASDKLTLTTEFNYVREDGFRAEGYGVAQYASYALSEEVTLNGRAEVWRDNNNFFVSNPSSNRDYINFQRGDYATFLTAPRPTTYSEFTVGLAYKPTNLPLGLNAVVIRPELRYDRALNGSRVFNNNRDRGKFTLSADVVVGF